MIRTALTLARFLLSAWFGAAALFVLIGVREITHPGFDSVVRDQLVLLRFPPYYVCGFGCLAGAVLSLGVCLMCGLRRRLASTALVLAATALGVMAYDYAYVYKPLEAMISPPGKARSAEFRQRHEWSKSLNAVQVGCVLAAAIAACAADGASHCASKREFDGRQADR